MLSSYHIHGYGLSEEMSETFALSPLKLPYGIKKTRRRANTGMHYPAI